MLVVVDGETPEIAREATTTLQAALEAETTLFDAVYVPGSGDFFARHGLLYRDLDDLDEFSLQIARVQPILTALEREPTVANLASLIEKGLEERGRGRRGSRRHGAVARSRGRRHGPGLPGVPDRDLLEEILLRGSSVETVTQW